MKSAVCMQNGYPILKIDGKPTTAMAYTTYFEERNRYEDFVAAGYRIFFVNVSFTTLPINPDTGFSPFTVGVFDDPDRPDYSEFEEAVCKILRKCPDAIIFPRIYVSMPKWWADAHPDDVIQTKRGGNREIMFSPAFREDGGNMLSTLIAHIKAADYAPRVGGWMLCGSATQEWIYRHYLGDLCPAAAEPYRSWVKKTYGDSDAKRPCAEDFAPGPRGPQASESAKRYAIFSNLAMAETLEHFAKTVKEATNHEQVVGTFYGYTFEEFPATFGSYALRAIISSPYLDFFSSPNAYSQNREFGIDWADMMPVDSLILHGKLPFMECDIRTYLTTGVQEARPGKYPDDIYTTSVWAGPPTPLLSQRALRKSFAHQVARGSAIWWFDMWGGWYDDPLLMAELAKLKSICDAHETANAPLSSEVVFFADEQAYANRRTASGSDRVLKNSRIAMGLSGAPFDTYMVEDAARVLPKYKAAVFPFYLPSEAGQNCVALCKKLGIPTLSATLAHPELGAEEIRAFLKQSGVHLYTEEKDVVYSGNGYLALHSATGGEKTLKLPKTCTVTPLFGADAPTQTTETVRFTLCECDTALFAISAVEE